MPSRPNALGAIPWPLGSPLLLLSSRNFPVPTRPAGRPVGGGEVVPGLQRVGVVVARHPLAVGESALEQRDRLACPPCLLYPRKRAEGKAESCTCEATD